MKTTFSLSSDKFGPWFLRRVALAYSLAIAGIAISLLVAYLGSFAQDRQVRSASPLTTSTQSAN